MFLLVCNLEQKLYVLTDGCNKLAIKPQNRRQLRKDSACCITPTITPTVNSVTEQIPKSNVRIPTPYDMDPQQS